MISYKLGWKAVLCFILAGFAGIAYVYFNWSQLEKTMDTSFVVRVPAYYGALKILLNNPVWGIGEGLFRYEDFIQRIDTRFLSPRTAIAFKEIHPHNYFFNQFLQFGLLALASHFLILKKIMRYPKGVKFYVLSICIHMALHNGGFLNVPVFIILLAFLWSPSLIISFQKRA